MSCLQNIEMKIIVFIFLISHCSGEYCSYRKGRTNESKGNCTELEHCVSNFDNQTGQCPGNQCEPGWMGPGCQYVNLAFNPQRDKVAFNPQRDKVFDGDMGTSRSISDGVATVQLNGTFFVHAIRIHSNTYDGSLLVQDKNQTVLFNDTFPQTRPTIFLYHTSLTDQLRIQFDPSLSIKEIEVFGGKNVALWKSTTQSSTYSEATFNFSSDKAVDGNGDGDLNTGQTCTHTAVGYSNPTWNVILGDSYFITSIKIKNRNTNQDRLDGFQLFGTTERRTKLLIYSDPPHSSDRSEIFLDSSNMPDVAFNEITIKIPSNNSILTLCEVYIYASFRRKKNNYCPEKCQTENLCNNVNFTCPVCEQGWEGPYCTPIKCPKPPLPAFVTISPDQREYAYGETVTFGCPPGYIRHGDLSKTCLHSSVLGQNLPSCTAIKCPKPPLPAFVTISPDKREYAYGETVTFGCPLGYTFNGDRMKACLHSSDLGQNLPSCTAIKCLKPQLPPLVTISPDKQEYAYGVTVTFGCRSGYTFNGDRMKACLHSSDLGQNLPSCAAIKCLKPPLPPFVTINPDKREYAYNETVTFGCPTGYSLNGEMVKDCLHSADLTQNLPSCAAITCGRPVLSYPLHISANSYKTSYNYNDSIEFTCSLGFTIQNPSVKYCTYTDAFQHNLPGCKEIQSTQISLTVAFLSGGAIGIVLLSSVIIVIVIIRRIRNLPKKKGNTDYEEGIQQSDLEDHEYAGMEQISNLSDGDFTKVSSVSENINPHNTVKYGHYEETSTLPDENDHEYAELKMVQMSLPRETTENRPIDS